jgi:tetratricopeptide (TPR) repeat protein
MMQELLIQYRVLIIAVFIAVGLLIFRKELNKLIDWLVSFKRISKTKDGYAASTASDSAGADSAPVPSEEMQSIIEKTKDSETEGNEPDTNWTEPFFAEDYARAREILRNVISGEEDPHKQTELRALLGHVMFEEDKQRGVEYFEELIRTGENASVVYEWYGLSYIFAGDYPKAKKVFLAGSKQNPANPELSAQLGMALQRNGEYTQAVEVLLENIRQNPQFGRSYRTLAQILVDIDMPDQALNCYRIGMQHCPQDADLIEEYVKILPEQDAAKERMSAYLSLVNIKPENPTYWTLLGNEYIQLGFHDMALEAYHKGNALAEEKEAWILANIGNIMNNQGFFSRGAVFLERAASINPSSQYAHERLGKALKLADDQRAKRDAARDEVRRDPRKGDTLRSLLNQVRQKLSQQPTPDDSSGATDSITGTSEL